MHRTPQPFDADRRPWLIQMSCGLQLDREDDGQEFVKGSHTGRIIRARRDQLQSWFVPEELRRNWKLDRLSQLGARVNSESDVGGLSRHSGLDASIYPGYAGAATAQCDLPAMFNEGLCTSTLRDLHLVIRAQKSSDFQTDEEYDDTDFLVAPIQTPWSTELYEARTFVALLMAHRRSTIFASNLSERIYNVWLPPFVVAPFGMDAASRGPLAGFPFITLTRQWGSRAWKRTFTMNWILCPTTDQLGRRPTSPDEIGLLVRSLDGPSTNPLPESRHPYRLNNPEYRNYVGDLLRLTKGDNKWTDFSAWRDQPVSATSPVR